MKYYCIGIKGAGMSTLAQLLFDLGYEVSGYDDSTDYKFTQEGLDKRNIKIYSKDTIEPLTEDTIVTYSKAFSSDHPELRRVKEANLLIKNYHELIGEISSKFETICVSGTHGKTTTSSLVTHLLQDTIGCNYFIGDGSGFLNKNNSHFVLESCEYQKHFLAYFPTYTIITNIELEHTECYDGIEDIRNTFLTFANKTKKKIIACGDDENIRKISFSKPVLYYGFNNDNDLTAKNITYSENGSSFDVYYKNELFGHFNLPLFGSHMVLNTLAAIMTGIDLGLSYEQMSSSLLTFENAKRRFKEEKIKDCIIIDDYAHHPTEIEVTLKAARQKYPNKKIVAIFKPNTYSRTLEMKDWFKESLSYADDIYVTEIDCNREKASDYHYVTSDVIIENLKNAYKLNEENIDVLVNYHDSVLCFMSCANISHLIDDYKKLKTLD